MNRQILDIESVIQPLLTRRRMLILKDAGVSEELLDADLYREVRSMKKELALKEKQLQEKDSVISEMGQTIAERDKTIAGMAEEIKTFKQRLGKLDRPVATSMNSNLPPSKNPIGIKHTNSLRKKSGRSNGGQPGHEGHTLYRSATPGKIELCVPRFCPCCGEPVSPEYLEEKERRQVYEIPSPILPVITEYVRFSGVCRCGYRLEGEFPAEAKAPVSYGPNVKAAVSYLSTEQAVPFKRLSEVMEYMFGIHNEPGHNCKHTG